MGQVPTFDPYVASPSNLLKKQMDTNQNLMRRYSL
jgi:hypothetical protein